MAEKQKHAALLQEFSAARQALLGAIAGFPEGLRDERLFGEWNLKQVIAHYAAWDRYFTAALRSLKTGSETAYWGSIGEFNRRAVEACAASTWEEVTAGLISAGKEFIEEYSQIPDPLGELRFWPGKAYTPLKLLQINVDHYRKAQYPDIARFSERGQAGKD